MHIHFLDPYQEVSSPIHRTDPRVKLVLSLAFILTTALIPIGAWPIYILLVAIIFSAAILSSVGIIYVLKRAVLAFPFMLAALPLVFTTPGLPFYSLNIGPWELTMTLAGVTRFISIALKSWISVQAAILLTATTPFPDLLVAMRAVRVPRLIVAIFGLMWRYLFVLADEALRLIRARAARSGDSGITGFNSGGSFTWRAQTAGGMAGNLFIRSLERSDRIYVAMLSRGYDGEVRTMPLPEMKVSNWIVLIVGGMILSLLVIFSYLVVG
ncbi:MAG: cobalt ECF transporter T component CbiQ [Anaerolineales bacterium]